MAGIWENIEKSTRKNEEVRNRERGKIMGGSGKNAVRHRAIV